MTDKLTTDQEDKIAAMALLTADLAGRLLKAAGYPEPTTEQAEDMGRLWTKHYTAFVRALGDTEPTTDEIEAVIEGAAEGGILRVIGLAPGTVLN
jgi:hypothetical protein